MDRDIERILEFDKIRGIIAGYCASGLGRSLAEKLEPLTDIAQIERMLNICSEAKEINVVSGGLPLAGLQDIRDLMVKAEVAGAILEPEELLHIAATARVARNLKAFAKKVTEQYPILAEIISVLSTFPHLEEAIATCIDPEGNILDTASPRLSKVRRQLVTARERIIGLLESILRSPQYQTAIQEDVVTLRNNRYVIPVKQSFRDGVPGVVQARSTSGVTVFVEPSGAVELNNQLRELADQELREVRRILRDLTDEVREALASLETTVRILAELDLINAKALLSINWKTTKPELNDRGYIELTQARHPLLDTGYSMLGMGEHKVRPYRDRVSSVEHPASRKVVPIDFHIGNGFDTLVITGPNTGGKTVALKTIGLLTIMMQVGLHIPANEGSQMSVFKQIFADVGDEQSIEQNLSTFSSHMTRIIRIVERADNSSLVLLDELGAGTEPSEGAALGMAVLDFLHSCGASTVATTHHDSLKAHAHSQDGMENASVTFDLRTLKPTYELRIGMPGSSNALRIADRLGLPKKIGEAARDYLGSEALEVADLISTVEGMQRELEEQQRLAEEKVLSASKVQEEHEQLLQKLKSKRRELERDALREASRIVQSARQLVENTIAELRKEKASPQSIQQARETLVRARKEIAAAIEPPSHEEGRKPAPGELKLGDEVYIRSLQCRGTLISLPDAKGMVQVRSGSAKINVSLSEVRLISNVEATRQAASASYSGSGTAGRAPNVINLQFSKKSNISSTLNLQGYRTEEALEKADKYLDDAALAGLKSVSIVHGKGTGALRDAVAELLSDHPHVASFRLGDQDEGGLGVTVVELRQ
jgi:DNA mismatch repair protein MutS2